MFFLFCFVAVGVGGGAGAATVSLMQIEQRLGLNHRHLVGISSERVDVQFIPSCLKVNVAERLQTLSFLLRVFDKYAATSRETLKVDVALTIQIRAHPLDLKIGHIIQPAAQSTFVRLRSTELKTLNQTSLRQRLTRSAYNLTQDYIAGKDAHNMSTAGNPDKRLIFLGPQLPPGIDLKKLRMQRPLE